MENCIDQQMLREQKIAQNARMYELGVLALSSRERAEVLAFQAAAASIIKEAETVTEQAVALGTEHGNPVSV